MTAAFPPDVLQHVVDAHCHPTEANSISAESMKRLQISVCAMSTHHGDQSLVRDLALQNSTKVVPCFGYHPWFTHLISLLPVTSKSEHYRHLFLGDDSQPSAEATSTFEELLPLLPEPITLEEVISDLRHNFELFSSTLAMLGEVGLDKQYRVAFDYHASPRRLTPFTIPLDHQLAILEAQIDLAVELRRNVSLHSVKCPQVTVDLINKLRRKHGEQLDNIRIDIHSCSMNPQVVMDLQKKHNNVFMSLSTTINGRSNNLNALITACSPNRLLIESDIDNIDRCTEKCIEILNLVARVKGWPVEEGWVEDLDKDQWGVVRRIEANWKTFIG
ncbi:TatD DNase family Scn1 [Mycena albidolilacea]|uniref:TatD DNase family Scn1 n=1 Tax=Mycena albidolilacea TaxID=1033008 RepID=A0AAD7AKT1_9AGAR|nr:TatD DNase family Scn1 [Mycena albidolilacea]